MRFVTASLLFAAAMTCATAAHAQDSLPDGPTPQASAAPAPAPNGPYAIFHTSMGDMTCQFFQAQAPETVANFIGLAKGTKSWEDPKTHKKVTGKPLYSGTIFHRVIPGFMIQGGDPEGTGEGDPGYQFKDEFYPGLTFAQPGMLAMANSGPGTNGSQFFITIAPTEHLNNHHTIFGQCDPHSVVVAESIAAVPRNGEDKPDTDVVLKSVEIVDALPASAAPATAPAAK